MRVLNLRERGQIEKRKIKCDEGEKREISRNPSVRIDYRSVLDYTVLLLVMFKLTYSAETSMEFYVKKKEKIHGENANERERERQRMRV